MKRKMLIAVTVALALCLWTGGVCSGRRNLG